MDQETLNNHYTALAQHYDKVYTTSETHRDGRRGYTVMGEQGARMLRDRLKLRPGDKLVDVGAGTCVTAGLLARLGGLRQPVLCVEPVQAMLDRAKVNKIANIQTLCETGLEFSQKRIRYDKLLMKMVVHHFPRDRLRDIFQGFYNQLNDNGIILIERASGNKGGMPYFKQGQWEESDEDRRFRDDLVLLLLELGFSVKTKVFDEVITQTKEEAKEYIRRRGASCWANMTDAQLEEGVRDVEINFGDIIEYTREREMIIATKETD